MKNKITLALSSIPCLLAAHQAAADYNGWVTPTSITYNFTSMNMNSTTGTAATLISTPFSVTFKRTDTDFASKALSNISVPLGRYVSVGLCSTGVTQLTLDGVKYDGINNTGGLNLGDVVYSTKADNSVGSVSKTSPAVEQTFTDPSGATCSITYFPSVLCITDASQGDCKAGDLVYTSSGAAANTKGEGKGAGTANTSFKINLMVDLYDSVTLDGTSAGKKVMQLPNVIAVVGEPGAAIHLSSHVSATTGTFNASMLFGADKKLLTLFTTQSGGGVGGTPATHTCRGSNNVAITGASANFPYSFLSTTSTTANSGKGQILAPIASSCQSTSTCVSVGTNQIDNFIQTVGNSATLQCISDVATAPLSTNDYGQPYVGGAGSTTSGTDSVKSSA